MLYTRGERELVADGEPGHSPCARSPSFGSLLDSLSQSFLMLPARLLGNISAIFQVALHREVGSILMFMKFEQKFPRHHKILPFFSFIGTHRNS